MLRAILTILILILSTGCNEGTSVDKSKTITITAKIVKRDGIDHVSNQKSFSGDLKYQLSQEGLLKVFLPENFQIDNNVDYKVDSPQGYGNRISSIHESYDKDYIELSFLHIEQSTASKQKAAVLSKNEIEELGNIRFKITLSIFSCNYCIFL